MTPFAILMLLVALWALCHFWLVPLSKDRWKAVDLREKMARAGSLVVLERVRDLSGIGAIVIFTVILLVWACGFLATSTSVVPQTVFDSAQSIYEVTREIGSQYGTTLGILGLLGAGLSLYFAARQARERVAQAWSTKAQQLHDTLIEDPSLLEIARSDPELSPLVARLDELVERLVAHESGTQDAALSHDELEQTHNQVSEVLSILAVEWARKDLNFEEAVTRPTEQETLQPPGRWRRLLRVFSSERLGKDLGLVKKPLSYITTALLILSLMGWSAEPLANSMQLMVNNLRMNAADQHAQREMEEALSAIPPTLTPNSEPTEQNAFAPTVQAATRLVARAALSELTRSTALEQWVQVKRSNRSESEFVRAALNEQRIEVPANADSATKARREVAATLGDVVEDKAGFANAQKQIEQAIEPSVARLKQENPKLFEKLIATLERRYGTPIAPLDAQGKLIAQVLDEAFGATDVKPTTELGKQAQKLVKDLGNNAVRTWTETWAKNWVTEALISAARPNVLAVAARQASFDATDDVRNLVRSLMNAEGQGWTSNPLALREAKVAEAVSAKVAEFHQPEMKAALAERLGGYDQLFPSDLQDSPSPHGRSMGGNATPNAGGAYAADRTFNRTRATNFTVASKSFRVRGVLIGQDTHPAGIDANQIRWTLQPASGGTTTKVTLEILSNDRWVNLGVYDAAIVNQALRYASDGRVVAVTIAPGDGKMIRRVTFTHPVLTDTPLGCRVVEADRIIDTFSFSNSLPNNMKNLSSDRQQTSRWLRIVNLTEALATLAPNAECPKKQIDKLMSKDEVEAAPITPALRKSLEAFTTQHEQKLSGSGRILDTAQTCMQVSNAQLSTCLCEKAKGIGLPDQYWFAEDHTSQFRERAVSAGKDWSWMKRSPDHLGNIDLWVHTTFSLRNAQVPGEVTDETTATALDFPAEELQQLRQEVSSRLPAYVKTQLKSPSYGDFMAPLEDFVLLQRFFRTALAGGLGQDFPVIQLIDLERETRNFVPYQPTIRWEEVPEAKLMEALGQTDPEAQENYKRWFQDYFLRLATDQAMCDRVSK